MHVPTVNILTRMVRIETAGGVGTAFTGEHRERHFLFTARHVVGDVDPVEARLAPYDGVLETSLTRVPGIPDPVDIAVFPLAEPLTPTPPLLLDPTGVMLGQDVWFLGYAYGMSFTAPGIGVLPLVKRAALSAIHPEGDATIFYLDELDDRLLRGTGGLLLRQNSNDVQVASVIAGYRLEELAVVDKERPEGKAVVQVNTGIIVTYNIGHATEAIDAHLEEILGQSLGQITVTCTDSRAQVRRRRRAINRPRLLLNCPDQRTTTTCRAGALPTELTAPGRGGL